MHLVSFFFFSPIPRPFFPLAAIVLFSVSMGLFVFVWFIHFFVDSTYKRNFMVFIFPCLAYFTQRNTLCVHTCCLKWQISFFFKYPVVYVSVSHPYLFIYRWTPTRFHIWAIANNAAVNIGDIWYLLTKVPEILSLYTLQFPSNHPVCRLSQIRTPHGERVLSKRLSKGFQICWLESPSGRSCAQKCFDNYEAGGHTNGQRTCFVSGMLWDSTVQ